MTTPILPNMSPMRDVQQIAIGDRLFYELGYKVDDRNPDYQNNWIRTGVFKEIEDVQSFIKHDKYNNDVEYLKHHNFMLIKKT